MRNLLYYSMRCRYRSVFLHCDVLLGQLLLGSIGCLPLGLAYSHPCVDCTAYTGLRYYYLHVPERLVTQL